MSTTLDLFSLRAFLDSFSSFLLRSYCYVRIKKFLEYSRAGGVVSDVSVAKSKNKINTGVIGGFFTTQLATLETFGKIF